MQIVPSLIFVCASALFAADAPREKLKIAVMPVSLATGAMGVLDARIMDESLLGAVQAAGPFAVIGKSDIDAVLGFEKQKDMMGCNDSTCFAEIGGALGVDRLVQVQIGKLASKWSVTAKLINVRGGAPTVEARLVQTVAGAEDVLVEAFPTLMQKLLKDGGLLVREITKPVEAAGAGLVPTVHSSPAGMELAKTETTVAQYRACVKAGKCTKPDDASSKEYCNSHYPDRDDHPVNCVDWQQASQFCAWAGGRLPTDEEWYAETSDGGKRTYAWGNDEVTCKLAVWGDGYRTDGCGRNTTWPVCSRPQGNSVSGLCDLAGNLWEWTSTAEGSKRVLRGASWDRDDADALRASFRVAAPPTPGGFRVGFRCGWASR